MDKIKIIFSKIKNIITDNLEGIIWPTVTLVSISFIVALALSVTNIFTAPKINELSEKEQHKAMSQLIDATSFSENIFSSDDDIEEFSYYIASDADNNILGYIFITTQKGYGGDIEVMTAVNPNCTVKAIKILDASSETPGLGQNVTSEKFYSQFFEKTSKISIVKNEADTTNNEIDAVTGATVSSKAVTRAVNQALDYAKQIIDLNNTTGGVAQ